MSVAGSMATTRLLALDASRLAWFDYAKGFCILLVVMLHSTLGVEKALHAEGFMHWVVMYAKPFRMPDFFVLSALFLAGTIDRPWRTYLDRKVLHFGYFYILWATIQIFVRHGAEVVTQPPAFAAHFVEALVVPFPTLWFLYVLPIFFVVTKLCRTMPPMLLWLAAALLHLVPLQTGVPAIDDYGAKYFIYFVTGYLLAPQVFRFAEWVTQNARVSLFAVAIWAVVNGALALTASGVSGYPHVADIPGLDIAAGLAGAAAIIAISALLARVNWLRAIRYAGQHSLVIYVAFTVPMAAMRTLLLKLGIIGDVGMISMVVWVSAAAVPLLLHQLTQGTFARFLFERPEALKLSGTFNPGRRSGPVEA